MPPRGALTPGLPATLFQYAGGAAVSGAGIGQVRRTFDGTDRALPVNASEIVRNDFGCSCYGMDIFENT